MYGVALTSLPGMPVTCTNAECQCQPVAHRNTEPLRWFVVSYGRFMPQLTARGSRLGNKSSTEALKLDPW